MTILTLKVYKENGLHVRLAAAFITTLQTLLNNKEMLKKIYVIYNDKRVHVNNLLSLVSLRIGQGDTFKLVIEADISESLKEKIKEFFKETEQEDVEQVKTDRLMMENSITLHEAISGLPNGIVVVNDENIITYVNEVAARLIEKAPQELINHRADEVIPESRLKEVMATKKVEVAKKQTLKNTILLTSRSPIIFEGKTIGAVAVFQDISSLEKVSAELRQVQELQQRLNLVMHSVSDLIGLTDETGTFIYSNEELNNLLRKINKKNKIQSIIGNRAWKGITQKTSYSMKYIEPIHDSAYIMKINTIIINEEFRGTVVTLSPFYEIQNVMQKLDFMEQRNQYLEYELSRHQKLNDAFKTIKGQSELLLESLTMANKVSKTNSTVLITGESGTGKELVAKAIHEASDRKEMPFIRVNCAAIPPTLIESELFGHEKGAFTGANKLHRGKFELANHGTIFLDEIGDLSPDLQAKILRVLQEREVDRIGGAEPIQLDVRVIAATNQNLVLMVEEGKFREDLYYRLNVIPIHLPPLRLRKDDIPYLVNHFRKRLNEKLGKSIKGYESGFLEALSFYHWPGNIRELQNIIERVINLTEDQYMSTSYLPSHILSNKRMKKISSNSSTLGSLEEGKVRKLKEYEKEIFTNACQHYPSYNQLAKALGITHKTAAKKVREYGLEYMLGKKYR